jgi:gluconolactonase
MNRVMILVWMVPAVLIAGDKHETQSPARGSKAAAAEPASKPKGKPVYETMGSIERLDPALDHLLPANAVIEKLASGFQWSEGPVWMSQGYLLFSDIPTNAVLKWQEGKGVSEFLRPSGYTGSEPRGGESGANGLTRDSSGRLVLCQHGDRRIARRESNGKITVLAQYYRLHRFNSPNDLVYSSKGDLYFTDPPYGLEKAMDDPNKELPFQGVFRLSRNGDVTLLTKALSFPNGLAFSPDQKKLYVANSDPVNPVIMVFEVKADGTLAKGRVFFNAMELAKARKGLPDGLKVDNKGNLFATGPGGVLVISPEGKHLGTILTGEPTANCAWGNDGSVLYITASHDLCRIKTSTRGRP